MLGTRPTPQHTPKKKKKNREKENIKQQVEPPPDNAQNARP